MTPILIAVALSAPVVPDALFVKGKVWTGAGPDVQALAVWKGRILAAGSDAEIKPLAGAGTKVIDLAGMRVMPGFYDSHLHFLGGGRFLSQVDLKDSKDEAEFGRRLAKFDAETPRDRWLLGGNWDHDRTFGGTLPTAAILDKYVPNRPAFLRRYDGHMAVANTAAMKLAGLDPKAADPDGGVIGRKADGTPDGTFKDNAMGLIDGKIPEPNGDEIVEGVRAAMKACGEHGITSCQDMEGSSAAVRRQYFRELQRLAKAGQLTVRVDVRWPIARFNEVANLGAESNFGSDFVRVGGVKAYMDGSLGSSTAKMFAPYSGGGENTGVYVTTPEAMKQLVTAADRAGLSVAVHAIGDRANADLLDIFESVAAGRTGRGFRVEHAQHLRPQDVARFGKLGVFASMQPYHVIDDGRWAEGRIGAERVKSSYSYKSISPKFLAFGSDWPVAPLNVLEGIDAAVTRRTLDGKHPTGWFPAESIDVPAAVAAYTRGSAAAAAQEADRGTLEVGKLADFVAVTADIFTPAERDRIPAAKVALTVVGGRVVYERKSPPAR